MGTVSVSLPSDGTTADVNDYNSPITTIVNTINGGIDNTNIASGAAIDGSKLASNTVTSSQINFGNNGSGIWWEEIARTTLTTAADTMTVSSLPARKYLRLVLLIIPSGGTVDQGLRFNNDTAANYSFRRSINGAADITSGLVSYFYLDAGALVSTPFFGEATILNIANQEKIGQGQVNGGGATTANNVSQKVEYTNKWANNSALINRIDAINTSGTGDFGIGSEIIVLGHN